MVWGDLLIGGAGLSVGSSVIERLPASAAKSGVQGGLGAAAGFLPVMGTIGGASMVVKQLKNIGKGY